MMTTIYLLSNVFVLYLLFFDGFLKNIKALCYLFECAYSVGRLDFMLDIFQSVIIVGIDISEGFELIGIAIIGVCKYWRHITFTSVPSHKSWNQQKPA